MPGSKRSPKLKNVLELWSFEVRALLLALCSLILLGPLRGLVDGAPLVLFVSSIVLFVMPGALLTSWFTEGHVTGGALVPVAFVISASIFGVLGVPALMMGLSIEVYLWASGFMLAAFLVVAAFRALYGGLSEARRGETTRSPASVVLWVLFLVLSTVLAFVSRMRMPEIYEDIWVYTAWVREFASAERLARYEPYFGLEIEGLSRAKINGWLLEQAALSRISGLDPVEMVLNYLTPTLVILALLSFYALAWVLLKDETVALFRKLYLRLIFLGLPELRGSYFRGGVYRACGRG